MLRKVLVLVAIVVVSVFFLSSCKKRASKAETKQEPVKTTAEYEAEAKEQIDKDNMSEELDSIETTMESEIDQEE